ncbi:MAG TPA: polymer-forming cytoskeletal protein [Rhabdochlamydiaceae bacterium]|nr:polymer-forming cytoskeletal protein [Rhabdochlamydiaceae bacterium]
MKFFIIFLLAFATGVYAEDEKQEKILILPRGQVHQGDYFAAESNIEVSGEVIGDVYVFGQQIVIDGTVRGDVIVFGGTVDISGEIEGNVRAVGGQILLVGNVGRNVTVIGGNAQLLYPATIKGNFVCVAGNCDMAATVGNDTKVFSSNLRVSGEIQNNLIAHVGDLRVTSNAKVGGNLQYSSNAIAFIDPSAQIQGKIIHHPSAFRNFIKGQWLEGFYFVTRIAGLLMNFLFSFVVGWVLIRFYPKKLHILLAALNKQPMKALVSGIVIALLLPIVALLLLVTILGAPFALALMGFFVIFFYAAKTIPILAVANKYLTKFKLKPNTLSLFAVALFLYFLLVRIPYIGILIALASLFCGVGAAVVARTQKRLK